MTPLYRFFLILSGVLGGVLGGLGLGGGTLLIPLLTLWLSVPQKLASFINLVTFIPMSAVALVIHSKNKLVSFKDAFLLLIPALGGAVAGSLLFREMSGNIGRIAFGYFLIVLGASSLVFSVVKKIKEKK